MRNKKQWMLMATMMLPLAVSADTLSEKLEMADTTFTVNGKKIVVDDRQEQTIISVYSPDGEEMLKKKEVEFAGEQEIEKIYISSPFLPNTYNKAHDKKVYRFENHIPSIYYDASILSGHLLGMCGADGLYTKDTKGYEFGISAFNIAIPFNRQHTIGLSFAMQGGFIHHFFDTRHALFNDNGTVSVKPIEEEGVKKSYISYMYARFPFMIEFQKHLKSNLYLGIGASLELRSNERSRYKCAAGTITPTKDLNMNGVGVNLEMIMGYAGFTLYLRSAITPLLKKSNSPECHSTSIGLGLSF